MLLAITASSDPGKRSGDGVKGKAAATAADSCAQRALGTADHPGREEPRAACSKDDSGASVLAPERSTSRYAVRAFATSASIGAAHRPRRDECRSAVTSAWSHSPAGSPHHAGAAGRLTHVVLQQGNARVEV